jgi:dCMP deaminase
MIIGVTGSYGAGKDSVAEILQQMNFYHVSLSDMIREEARKRKIELTRDNLIKLGNDLRTSFGAEVLARRALEKVREGENYVFTSVRNPAEVELLQKREDFLMIKVVAPEEVRLKRLVARSREEDPTTLAEMRAKAAKENTSNPNSQQLLKVASMAKVTINNDADLEALKKKVQKLVEDHLYALQPKRPDWDHYFMEIAESVKNRATCMSAKKGAIIVKNKQIVSTGYNGTARGIEHCTKGGCPRCTARHLGKIKSGDYSLTCTCCHSEENAIVQAAHHGISTNGATMYTTFTPCSTCARMIINAGIVEVVAKVMYPDDIGTSMLKEAGVKLRVLK